MKVYEKPQIQFERFVLFEKIADRCWAGGTIPINDLTENPVDDEIEGYIHIRKKGNCGKDELEQFLCQLRGIIKDPTKYDKFVCQNMSKFKQNTKTNTWTYKS